MTGKYWFRQKTYGYGATPSTWQGWVLTAVATLLCLAVVVTGPYIQDEGLRALWMTLGVVAVLIPFVWVSWRKTEGGWRWRFGRDD